MKKSLSLIILPLFFLLIFQLIACNSNRSGDDVEEKITVTPDATDSMPFKLVFTEKKWNAGVNLPRVQSYSFALPGDDGLLLIMGGRRQGLHTFKSEGENFVRDSSNNFIYVLDINSGDIWNFDVNELNDELSAPLQATNQQFYLDRESGNFYIVGGYGWKADGSDMKTFSTMIRVNAVDLIDAVKSNSAAGQIQEIFDWFDDERLAVTGGELLKKDNAFYLIMGQLFNGQYRAFGGANFVQKYTEEIKVFTLNPNDFGILSYGATTSTEQDHPFHRRDLNIIEDIDPATGQERITVLGGVFPPGIIGAYTYPIYIQGPQDYEIDRSIEQKFSQYECPVISVYDDEGEEATVYHTFFGGISHYYYFQTDSQKAIYNLATEQGRNDGLPFIGDITTLQLNADGSSAQYIFPEPIPGNRLLGTSTHFIPNPDIFKKGISFDNGVIKLSEISKEKVLIGYIYGGIEAEAPLPKVPNTGTFVSNSFFEVYISNENFNVIPASKAKESTKDISGLPYLSGR